MNRAEIKARLAQAAAALGFDAFRVTTPERVADQGGRLAAWLAAGWHAEMGWLADTAVRRRHPLALWPLARSILVVGANYAPESDPLATLAKPNRGAISVYAARRDYHEVLKGRLKLLADQVTKLARPGGGARAKVFVDTAPLMEKPVAAAAGLGWQGKHSVLVSRDFGSWLFLGAVLTDLDLPPDAAETDHCGSCRRCLDICPTAAFPEPYVLDSARCIAYLTVEHAGPIDRALRPLIGNRIFGCDDCLAVCPWNKFAAASRDTKLALRADLAAPDLAELARLDDAAFRARFAGTPVKRAGRARFLRNVLIAIGNSGLAGLAVEARRLTTDTDPVVRGAAIWALSRLLPAADFSRAAAAALPAEDDPAVREEWQAALAETAQSPTVP